MKSSVYILYVFLFIIAGCMKDEPPPRSGIVTLNNLRHNENSTYATYGISFALGKTISTEAQPGPDFSVDVNANYLVFMANNLNPSFYRYGEYIDEVIAKMNFESLTQPTFTSPVDIGGPILPNQIWIYKSGKDTYAKIRIISTTLEKRENLGQIINFGECKFEWVYQPDGTLTFP